MNPPRSNEEFLSAIFSPLPADGARPNVCGFAGHPKHGQWGGHLWQPAAGTVDGAALNWYFTLATYHAGGKRQAADCVAICGVMLDDVGSAKGASLEQLRALPPSALVETSPDNYQALYLFDTPATDIARVIALQAGLIRDGLCDPGADGPAARYARILSGSMASTRPPLRVGW